MYYVITKGGGGVRKWQFLITFSTESNHKGGRGGGQKPQNLDYVIHGCSLTAAGERNLNADSDTVEIFTSISSGLEVCTSTILNIILLLIITYYAFLETFEARIQIYASKLIKKAIHM